ncbi:hypothetical protein AK830_g3817 [Neonectria ditissima]|uniref:Uncharacterized protein n=1 Tax=Neonectria ditissima TaxID=78410 RepID=A0A0P7BQB8_9HYPO|nr:hypothetical protein AK830_g3817 [Neonectria ditissima]
MQLQSFEWDNELDDQWLENQARLVEDSPEWNAFLDSIEPGSAFDTSFVGHQAQDQAYVPPIDLDDFQYNYSLTSSGYHPLPLFDSVGSSPIETYTPSLSGSSFADPSPQS